MSSGRCATFQRALAMAVRALLGRHLRPVQAHVGDPGQRADPGPHVVLELRPQRAAGGGERDGDVDRAVGPDLGVAGHAQVDDVAAELGIDHAAEHSPESSGGGGAACGPRARFYRSRPVKPGDRRYTADP